MDRASTAFDLDAVFDEDYLYFYETFLTPDVSEREASLILRLLDVRPGARVLDLACGDGRIAGRLASAGCRVTGLDRTSLFLDRGRREAEAAGLAVDYVAGDMRSLPWLEEFDLIINWFTSFGYFDDHDNRKVLAGVHRALVPGGRLLIEHQNRDLTLRRFQFSAVFERDGNFMIDRNRYDVVTGRSVTERVVLREGRSRRFQFSFRLFTYPELRDWLLQAGFREAHAYGNDGEPLRLASQRMIVVATK